MIDAELVTRKMVLISKDLESLRGLAGLTLEAFLASSINPVLAERYVERAVGRMIDINYHLITESGQAPPPDYFQSFIQMAVLGVYPDAFGRRIAVCAGLRNRIAHEYDEIDPKKLYEAVGHAVDDVPEYLRAVDTWLPR
jgi:uncharacterized protein YutE (UPF0331/DUF86 family)